MHRYMRAAGFADLDEDRLLRLIWDEVVKPENISSKIDLEGEVFLIEYRLRVNRYIGVCAAVLYAVRCQHILYYYPYYQSFLLTSREPVMLERHTQAETYSGVLDDFDTGISLIFFVTNPLAYRLRPDADESPSVRGVGLTAFANEGTVILPVYKKDEFFSWSSAEEGSASGREARIGGGDETETTDIIIGEELEGLMELSERMETEDLYSVVEQSFMPYGVECDIYSVIAEILLVEETTNLLTGEELYLLKLTCNDIVFSLCMRKTDLTGEPEEGRRIKCKLWMQGHVYMLEEPEQQ